MLDSLPIALFLLFYYVRYRGGRRESSTLLEGATVFLFSYAVISSLLSLFGAYNHLLIVSLMALAMAVAARGRDLELQPSIPRVRRDTAWFLVIAAVYLCFADQRSEFIRMGSDAGVYCNYAKNMVATGGGRFESEYLVSPEKDLGLMSGWPAVGFFEDETSGFHYQFFPGWPSLLALGMSLFGRYNYTYIMPIIGVLSIYWIFRLLRHWLGGRRLIAATLCLALNPLLIYFSKYCTSELLLFLVSIFVLHAGACGSRHQRGLALLAIAAAAVSHISLFLYVPLLLVYGAHSAIAGNGNSLVRFRATAAIFLAHLAVGYQFSPKYYEGIFAKFGSFAPALDFYYYPMMIGLVVLVFSLGANRWAGYLSPGALHRMARLIPLWVAFLLGYSVWRGYQLGWTDDLAHLPARETYVNLGLESVLHVTIVSVALASGVVFFLLFLAMALIPRLRLISDTADLFLAAAVLPAMTFYFFILPDVRHNYYLSRYFLPVIAPFIVIFVLKRAAGWRRWKFWATVGPVLAFNVFYSSFVATTPEHQGRNRMIRELEAVIPAGAPVFALGAQRSVHLLFSNIVRYDLEAEYGYLGQDFDSGMRMLGKYVAGHDPDALYLVSDREVPLDASVASRRRFVIANNNYVLRSKILYPYKSQKTEERFFLYSVEEPGRLLLPETDFSAEEIARLSPASFWTKAGEWSNGEFAMVLPRPIRGVTRLRIETGGRFLHYSSRFEAVGGEVMVEINGRSYRKMLDAEVLTIELGSPLTVETLAIRSATFVPAELGINDDPRSLGLDIDRLILVGGHQR